MVVVVTPAVVIVKVVIRSDLIYIVIGCSMCGVCSCGGVIFGYSVSSLTSAVTPTATTTAQPYIPYHHQTITIRKPSPDHHQQLSL